ncbi:hypothetical protein CVS40_11994 [Lucilia cuprina]|nr:hypothetical protein CVS40_11994 [Lucilia cuprina]
MNRELKKVHDSIGKLADAVMQLSLRDEPRPSQSQHRPPFDFPKPFVNPNMKHTEPPSNDGFKIRIDKFGLEFSGNQGGRDQLSVEEFVFRLEHMQRQYQIPWNEILRDFHVLVKGTVRQWYWAQLQTTVISDWGTLRLALINRYKTVRSNWELMQELVERKQMPGESTDDYFHSLNLLRAKLEMPISEGEMIRIAKRNLKESLARMVYSMAVNSMEHLRMKCLDAKRTFPRRDTRNMPGQPTRSRRYISEVMLNAEDEENGFHAQVAAIGEALICRSCQQKGHLFKDCLSQQRSLFCYKCGRPNTITRDGESRSTETAPKPI